MWMTSYEFSQLVDAMGARIGNCGCSVSFLGRRVLIVDRFDSVSFMTQEIQNGVYRYASRLFSGRSYLA